MTSKCCRNSSISHMWIPHANSRCLPPHTHIRPSCSFPKGMGLLKTSTTFNGRTKTEIEVVQMNASQQHEADLHAEFDSTHHPTLHPEHEHHDPATLMAAAEAYFSAANSAVAQNAGAPDGAPSPGICGEAATQKRNVAIAAVAAAAAAAAAAKALVPTAATTNFASATTGANGGDPFSLLARSSSGLPSGVRLGALDPVDQAKRELAAMASRQKELLAIMGAGAPAPAPAPGASTAGCSTTANARAAANGISDEGTGVENHINQLNAGFKEFTRVMV